MWTLPTAIYWSSLGLVGYTYAGYPAAILLWSRLRPRPIKQAAIQPTVSVVLAAFNEELHIAQKLDNLLSLDYPHEKLQLIVVSDGSSDATESIVEGYLDRGVELLRLPHGGKPTALNQGVERAHGEVVVFCDARQQFAPDSFQLMAEFFADPQVGSVVGELQLPANKGPGVYWRYERLIREAEGKVDSVVGGSGCFMAIRRHLFQPLPADTLLDDMYTPMQIVLQGYRVLHRPEIKVYDNEGSISGEFSRKARTLAGNFQLLRQLPHVLDPRRNRIFFQFVSHKLCRLACPVALASLLASNAVLVATFAPGWPFYAATLVGQLGAYGLALKGAIQGERAGRLARVSHTFVTLNLAAVEGFRRYLKQDLAWTTERHETATSAPSAV